MILKIIIHKVLDQMSNSVDELVTKEMEKYKSTLKIRFSIRTLKTKR